VSVKLKVEDPRASAFMKEIVGLPTGGRIKLPSSIPGFSSEETEAICTEADPIKHYWAFGLYFLGIHVADVSAEINGNHLWLEHLQ
jgi:hypothetical protein